MTGALVLAVLAGFAGTLWQLNQAQRNAAENRRQIARLNVLNGVNLMQEGDYFRSVLWFAEVLALYPDPPARAEVDRQRIASIVAHCPKLVAVITHDGQPISHAAFHPTRQQLATVGRDRRLRIWDVPTGNLLLSTEPFAERPSGIWFSPDGERILLISSEFNHATLLAAASGKTVAGPVPHFVGGANNHPLAPRFDASGQRFVTHSQPKTVQLWSASDGSPLGPPLVLDAPIEWMDFSPDGQKIFARTLDGRVTAWDWQTGQMIQPALPLGFVTSQTFLGPGELAVTAGQGQKRIWNLRLGAPVGPPLVHPQELLGAAFDPNRGRVLTFGRDRTARLWDTLSGEVLLPPFEHPSPVENAVFSPDGQEPEPIRRLSGSFASASTGLAVLRRR